MRTVVGPALGEDDFFYGRLFTELTGFLIEDHEMVHTEAFFSDGVPIPSLKGSPSTCKRWIEDIRDRSEDPRELSFFNL